MRHRTMDGRLDETENEEHSSGGGRSRRVGLCPGPGLLSLGSPAVWGDRQAHLLGQG